MVMRRTSSWLPQRKVRLSGLISAVTAEAACWTASARASAVAQAEGGEVGPAHTWGGLPPLSIATTCTGIPATENYSVGSCSDHRIVFGPSPSGEHVRPPRLPGGVSNRG